MTRAPARWAPPEGVAVRGTVVLLPGRGEHPGLYTRLGTRLAFDGYRVVAVASPDDVAGELRGNPVPVVLLGSDTGGLAALTLATELPVHAVVAAGLPLSAEHVENSSWESELDARTACPVHRTLLEADDRLRRGALLADPAGVPAVLPRVPVLVLHGGVDRVADPKAARALAEMLPAGRFALVEGGRHDVLNDVAHRSVAAEIVQFLEWLRAGTRGPVLVRG
ncbi:MULTISPECIES: serine aminopeptidase domain-containing protein [unclassified Amycolatopsis]|uniref:alpha/beta hydrolase n=1 Tax=unclassified Amycolatopsis TaxID=2618356 RepID=UPI002877066F|nr:MULTISPECIES: alpha/beta hydrolase [unclassified Amycolatopsis]MDS0135792.1 alpha/beta hydrolase [Amycolatopsis sp. 505]MDS0145607.1 alpha/beta hydrolase [Amycolatopsis sp. CM201R]